MLDPRAPPAQASRPRPELEVDARLIAASPPQQSWLPAEHHHGDPRVAQVHERREHADTRARHDGLPLEPELEQIAVDQQRCGATRHRA